MRRAFFLVSLIGASLVPSLALADDEPPPPLPAPTTATTPAASSASTTVDAVHLRNGGFYRGRVTEIVPGDHVTVVVAPGGETKRIPWPEVDRVIVASTPVPPTPTASAPAASPPTPPAPMVGPRARVHITAPKQVILYRRAAGTSAFQQVCTSPCDLELPIGDTYKLAGNGLSQNKELHLAAGPGGFVDIVVDPPSTGGMILGGFIAGGGATAAYVGLLMALIGQADAEGNSCYSSTSACAERESDGKTIRNAGLVTMVVGAGITVLGVVVFINSASTDIGQRTGGGAAQAPNDAFLRKPTWRSVASSAESATGAPAAAFPLLFTHRF
jgi:F0F1-type ATP synthase membrane subunit c/vacuolar-type H+-ATPase subunit K